MQGCTCFLLSDSARVLFHLQFTNNRRLCAEMEVRSCYSCANIFSLQASPSYKYKQNTPRSWCERLWWHNIIDRPLKTTTRSHHAHPQRHTTQGTCCSSSKPMVDRYTGTLDIILSNPVHLKIKRTSGGTHSNRTSWPVERVVWRNIGVFHPTETGVH